MAAAVAASSDASGGSRPYAYIDLDVASARERLSRAAAFVFNTDTRYGFSSKDIRTLGGSELQRIGENYAMDHEWAGKGEIETHPPPVGCRVVVELFTDVSPQACDNFIRLCRGQEPGLGACGKPLAYVNSNVHRVQSGFVIQGGDFAMGNGSGGEPVINGGKKFKDERPGLALKHDRAGVLSMGNSGKNSNSSQFFITLAATPVCDGKHTVFGRVVSGMEVLQYVEEVAGSENGTPTEPVAITGCGEFFPGVTPGQGYWIDYPDPDAYGGTTPLFMVRPRVLVIAPSASVGERFSEVMAHHGGTGRGVSVRCVHPEQGDWHAEAASTLVSDHAVDLTLVAAKVAELAPDAALLPLYPSLELERVVVTKPAPGAIGTVLETATEAWQSAGWLVDV